MKSGATGVRKLEEKLEQQLASAKWTVQQIQEISRTETTWGSTRR